MEGLIDLLLNIWARSLFDPLGEIAGLSEHEVVVVESERLKRCSGVEFLGVKLAGSGQSKVVMNRLGVVRTTKR